MVGKFLDLGAMEERAGMTGKTPSSVSLTFRCQLLLKRVTEGVQKVRVGTWILYPMVREWSGDSRRSRDTSVHCHP